MAPIKSIQVRKRYAPWLSPAIKEAIRERDEAQQVAQQSRSNEDWKKFKKLRNNLNNKLRGAKRKWQKVKIAEYSSDSASAWKHINSWLGWSSCGPPTKLLHNGVFYSKPSKLSEIMNCFFIKKVENLRKNLPVSDLDPLELVRNLVQGRQCNFNL